MGAWILSKFQPNLKQWTNGVRLTAVRLCHTCSDMTPLGQFSAMNQDLQLPQPKTCTPQDLHPLHSLELPLVHGGCLLAPLHRSMLQISPDPCNRSLPTPGLGDTAPNSRAGKLKTAASASCGGMKHVSHTWRDKQFLTFSLLAMS